MRTQRLLIFSCGHANTGRWYIGRVGIGGIRVGIDIGTDTSRLWRCGGTFIGDGGTTIQIDTIQIGWNIPGRRTTGPFQTQGGTGRIALTGGFNGTVATVEKLGVDRGTAESRQIECGTGLVQCTLVTRDLKGRSGDGCGDGCCHWCGGDGCCHWCGDDDGSRGFDGHG